MSELCSKNAFKEIVFEYLTQLKKGNYTFYRYRFFEDIEDYYMFNSLRYFRDYRRTDTGWGIREKDFLYRNPYPLLLVNNLIIYPVLRENGVEWYCNDDIIYEQVNERCLLSNDYADQEKYEKEYLKVIKENPLYVKDFLEVTTERENKVNSILQKLKKGF